ncbi:MAG: CsbD family protein [Rhodobacteraceae bacterium]|nr:CsbD family protein [Paracoccaceae bacterium]
MDKDRIVGSAKVVKGKLKVAVGKSIGDSKLEAEGQAEKVEGKIQNAVGASRIRSGMRRERCPVSAPFPGRSNLSGMATRRRQAAFRSNPENRREAGR